MQQLLRSAVLAWAAMLLPWGADAALADKRVALVIGNSAYQNAPSLPNPARDARAMADMFRKVGFDVVSAQYDIGNLDLKRAIRQFEDAAADADIAVVYYAGHGLEINGVNYLIPVDAKLASDRDAEDEAVTLERLISAVDGTKRLRLVILDACRDSPFVRTMKQQRQIRGISAGLGAAEPSSTNTLIAYAAKAGSVAIDGDGDHSPFTAALLDNLFTPGLDIRLAFGRVRDEVLKRTANQQEPFVYGSLGGANFALVPAAPVGPAPEVVDAAAQADYNLVKKIGTKTAWEVFLKQYSTGFYHDLAREQLAMVLASEKNDVHEVQSGNNSVVTRNVQSEQQGPPQGTPAVTASAPNGQPQTLLWWWPQWR
jgi:Caspase domain